ncbi:MAG TPA: hypothetical protein VNN73_17530 [Blastocatellia bacterium]|nr:hypothetical protein [Blastocatellia bacterium]
MAVTFSSKVKIDWNDDGDYEDALEDVTSSLLVRRGVAATRGKDQLRVQSPPRAGDFRAVLSNDDRTYSIENTSSPLYGALRPGHRVRWEALGGSALDVLVTDPLALDEITTESGEVLVTEATATGSRALFTGILDDLPQRLDWGDRTVEIPALGTLSRLRDKSVSVPLLENITTGQAIGAILDAAGWPATERRISSGQVTLLWYWLDDQNAFDAIIEILNTEGAGAAVYEDAEGWFVFEDRRYRQSQSRSLVAQSSYSSLVEIEKLDYSKDFKDITNSCRIVVKKRTAAAETVVWSIEEQIPFAANETKVFHVTASDPFRNAQTPSTTSGIDEVQTLEVLNATEGGFGISYNGESAREVMKGGIQVGSAATATDVKNALESIPGIGVGNVVVTGGPLSSPSQPVRIRFTNQLGHQDVALLDVTSQLTGTNATVTVREETRGRRPDYKVSSGSIASVSIDRTSGSSLKLTVTAGAAGAIVEWIQVRAQPVPVEREIEITNSLDASASIAKYGEKAVAPQVRAEISEADARAIADSYAFWYMEPRASATIQLKSISSEVLADQMVREISDAISVTDDQLGLNALFWIESITHEMTTRNNLTTRFGLEFALAGASGGSFCLYDVGVYDTDVYGF